jgi:hypothetical protein
VTQRFYGVGPSRFRRGAGILLLDQVEEFERVLRAWLVVWATFRRGTSIDVGGGTYKLTVVRKASHDHGMGLAQVISTGIK